MAGLVAATFLERTTRAAPLPLADTLLIQCSVSTVLFTGIAVATGAAVIPTDGRFWFAVAWVVLLSTFGGYGCYWLTVRRGSVTRASTLLYLTPPTTMLLAFLMFGERITTGGLAGLVVCASAVALVLRSPRTLSVPRAMMSTCCSTTSSRPPDGSRRRARARPRQPSSPGC
jgi:drug/metabolite transporter (DMT)-like permease